MKVEIKVEMILETEHPDLVNAPKLIIAGAIQEIIEKAVGRDRNAECRVTRITVE